MISLESNKEFSLGSLGVLASKVLLLNFIYAGLLALAQQSMVSRNISKRKAGYFCAVLQLALLAIVADDRIPASLLAAFFFASSFADDKALRVMQSATTMITVSTFLSGDDVLTSFGERAVAYYSGMSGAIGDYEAMNAMHARFFNKPVVLEAQPVAQLESRPALKTPNIN